MAVFLLKVSIVLLKQVFVSKVVFCGLPRQPTLLSLEPAKHRKYLPPQWDSTWILLLLEVVG